MVPLTRAEATAVAAVKYSGPRDEFTQTFFASVALAKELCVQAQQPIVVQGLYDRNARRTARIIDRGSQQRKEVVDMNDVRSFALHQGEQLVMNALVPYGIAEQDQWVLTLHLLVAGVELKHLVATRTQQFGLPGKDLVLAAGRLIRIVHRENLHMFKPFACAEWLG